MTGVRPCYRPPAPAFLPWLLLPSHILLLTHRVRAPVDPLPLTLSPRLRRPAALRLLLLWPARSISCLCRHRRPTAAVAVAQRADVCHIRLRCFFFLPCRSGGSCRQTRRVVVGGCGGRVARHGPPRQGCHLFLPRPLALAAHPVPIFAARARAGARRRGRRGRQPLPSSLPPPARGVGPSPNGASSVRRRWRCLRPPPLRFCTPPRWAPRACQAKRAAVLVPTADGADAAAAAAEAAGPVWGSAAAGDGLMVRPSTIRRPYGLPLSDVGTRFGGVWRSRRSLWPPYVPILHFPAIYRRFVLAGCLNVL